MLKAAIVMCAICAGGAVFWIEANAQSKGRPIASAGVPSIVEMQAKFASLPVLEVKELH